MWRDYAALPRLFWTLWVGVLVNRIGWVVLPFLGLYLTSRAGLTTEQAGLIVGAYGAGQIAASWVGGVLADRIGRKLTILIALFGGSGMMLVLGRTHGMIGSLCAVLALACFSELYRPAFGALITDIVPEGQRYLAFSANHWAINLGFAIAMATGGLIARIDYALLFYIDAATTLSYALLIAWRLPETRPQVSPALRDKTSAALWRNRSFMAFLGLQYLLALVFSQATFTLPLYLRESGFDEGMFGSLMACNGVLIVLAQPSIMRFCQKQPTQRVFVYSALAHGVGFGLHGASRAGWVQFVAVMVWTVGEIAVVPMLATVVAALAPVDQRGRYQGALAVAWSLAMATGPVLGGALLSRAGSQVLWASCFALSMFAVGLALVSRALAPPVRSGVLSSPPAASDIA